MLENVSGLSIAVTLTVSMPALAPSMTLSWRAVRPIETPSAATRAGGIATRVPVPEALEMMAGVVDELVRRGQAAPQEELRVARISTVVLGLVSIGLGLAFKGQNVAYMVGLAFAIAASANFPALVLSIFWRRFTTRAAQLSMFAGTASSLLLIAFSPAIMVDLLQQPAAIVPLKNPGIISIPLSFAVAIITTILLPEPESERKYAEVAERVHLGERI